MKKFRTYSSSSNSPCGIYVKQLETGNTGINPQKKCQCNEITSYTIQNNNKKPFLNYNLNIFQKSMISKVAIDRRSSSLTRWKNIVFKLMIKLRNQIILDIISWIIMSSSSDQDFKKTLNKIAKRNDVEKETSMKWL